MALFGLKAPTWDWNPEQCGAKEDRQELNLLTASDFRYFRALPPALFQRRVLYLLE